MTKKKINKNQVEQDEHPLQKDQISSLIKCSEKQKSHDKQIHKSQMDQSSQSEQVQAAIKSMKFRQKRGTRMKDLISGKFRFDNFWEENGKYFGGNLQFPQQDDSQDDEYQQSSSGRDQFDSDFDQTDSYQGKRGRKKGSKLNKKSKPKKIKKQENQKQKQHSKQNDSKDLQQQRIKGKNKIQKEEDQINGQKKPKIKKPKRNQLQKLIGSGYQHIQKEQLRLGYNIEESLSKRLRLRKKKDKKKSKKQKIQKKQKDNEQQKCSAKSIQKVENDKRLTENIQNKSKRLEIELKQLMKAYSEEKPRKDSSKSSRGSNQKYIKNHTLRLQQLPSFKF